MKKSKQMKEEMKEEVAETPTVSSPNESVEDIQKAIADLNAKLTKKVDTEEEKEVEKIELPLASVHVSLVKGRGQTMWKHNVSPPEAAVLVSMFQDAAGEVPIIELKLNSAHKAGYQKEAEEHEAALQEYAEAAAKGEGKEFEATHKDTHEHPVRVHRLHQAKKKAAQIVSTVSVDPRRYKAYLQGKYPPALVEKLFPGSEPGKDMPKTFSRAIGTGVAQHAPKSPYSQGSEARLFDLDLVSP